jgi:sialic acid synthase
MPRELNVNGTLINDNSECYVIAEIGHNHQGSLQKAKDLFRSARECGADAVKMQKRDNKTLYTRKLYDSPYDNENSFGDTYGAHREALEFGSDEYAELKKYAKELGITMFATAFDFKSADFLAKLDMPAYKIASGDLKNTPLLKYVAKIGKPMFVSTGGGTLDDVKRAYYTIMAINPKLCLMQCTASYPVEPQDMNLSMIPIFRQNFPEVVVGLSDHQSGIIMSPIAYVLGARVVEKHFTLNHAWKGTDNPFSLEPIGLRKMVRDLRRVHVALGDGVKKVLPGETKPLLKMAKKLVAAHDLPSGHKMAMEDIAMKSPGDGLPPYEIESVIGKKTRRPLKEDDSLAFEDLTDS